MIRSSLVALASAALLFFPLPNQEESFSGKFTGDGASFYGELTKFKEAQKIVKTMLPGTSQPQSGNAGSHAEYSAPTKPPVTVALPFCTDVTETDAWNLDCMQNDIGVCPDGQFLMVEYKVVKEKRISTGKTFCSATNDVETAPGTILEAAQPVEIVVTLRDLQRLEVGASKVLSANMKRDGKYVGLRNRPIHMWTEAGEVNRTITMFGQNVQIRLTPASYTWNYGDGSSQKTAEAGSKVDADFTGETKTSHSYSETGTYQAQVTVSYAGQFRVGNEDWVPVVGMLEVPSETASMDIWRKKVYPVADDCDANPQGWGCDSLFQEEKPGD